MLFDSISIYIYTKTTFIHRIIVEFNSYWIRQLDNVNVTPIYTTKLIQTNLIQEIKFDGTATSKSNCICLENEIRPRPYIHLAMTDATSWTNFIPRNLIAYSDWLLLTDRCVVIGCLLINSHDTFRSMHGR